MVEHLLGEKEQEESLRLRKPLPLACHPAEVYLDSLAPGSRATMRQALNAIASILTNGECDALSLDWSKLRYVHTATVRSVLVKKKLAPATINKMLCALRRVLAEAQKLDLISSSDYTKAIDISNVKEDSRLRGRLIQQEEVALLLELLEEGRNKKEPGEAQPIDIRDMALIAILRGGGLRRNEAVSLELKDFNPRTGAVEVRQGKGGKSRIVYLPEVAVELVIKWLGIRGRKSGALLCPVVKGGKIVIRHLSADAVGKTLQRLGKKAGLASFSAHDFRRTFCSELLDLGADIVTVQKLAGHASPATTAIYDRRGEEVKRSAIRKMKF